jgi:hypothetical protein
LNPSFPVIRIFFAAARRVTPLSPPVGEAAQGDHPLAPFFIRRIIFNLLGVLSQYGGCLGGGGGSTMCWSPQERLLVSLIREGGQGFDSLSESKIRFLDMRVVHELFCLSFLYDPPVFKDIAAVAHVERMPYVLLQK